MEYVEAIRRHWLIALLVVLAVMVPTTVANVLAPRHYSATTKLWVGVQGGGGVTDLSQKVTTASDLMSTYPELVRSSLVLDPVVEKLGLPTSGAELAGRVVATVPNNTLILSIEVTDDDASRAAQIANAVAAQFGVVVGTLPQVSTGKGNPAKVETTVLQAAVAPGGSSSPDIVRNLGVALVLGLVLAGIVTLVVNRYFAKDRPTRRPASADAVPAWD